MTALGEALAAEIDCAVLRYEDSVDAAQIVAAILSVLKDRLPADDRELVERLRKDARMLEEWAGQDERPTLTGFGINVLHGSVTKAADRITAYSASSLESGADPAFAATAVGPVSRPAPSGINPGERAD